MKGEKLWEARAKMRGKVPAFPIQSWNKEAKEFVPALGMSSEELGEHGQTDERSCGSAKA
eukprot:8342220-Karenia_brevis.AAC.1